MRPVRSGGGGIESRRASVLLHIALFAGFLPLIVMAVFSRFPEIPVRIMPIGFWALIEREYWLPCAVLFFACASQLATAPNRRMLRVLVVVLLAFVTAVTGYRLFPIPMHDFGRNIKAGVCLQSSGYTCGAASLVTLLNEMGVEATEGEMARLTGTIPGRGVSDFQAAYGLQQKLAQLDRPERVQITYKEDRDPTGLATPFLAGMKFSFFFDHMVCVLSVNEQGVEIGDPLQGRRTMRGDEFRREWRGFAITAETEPAR